MAIIYVVTSGQYSDYRIHAVFSTEALAGRYIEAIRRPYDDVHIEQYELDAFKMSLRKGFNYFGIRMTKDGDSKVERASPDEHDTEPCKIFDNRKFGSGVILYVETWAKDEQHAVKIANEKRVQLIALGKWPD